MLSWSPVIIEHHLFRPRPHLRVSAGLGIQKSLVILQSTPNDINWTYNTTGRDPTRTMRLSDEFIAKVDVWAAQQGDKPVRSEAIRRLVELGLKAKK